MNKKRFIILVVFLIMILSGCSKEEEIDYTLVKDNISSSQISMIEMEKDIYINCTENHEEIDELTDFIASIKYLKGDFENINDSEDMIRIKIYNQKNSLSKSLSISEEAAYYDKKWYPIDKQIYDRILSLYNDLEEEMEDEGLIDVKQIQNVRKGKSVLEALQGTWISEDTGDDYIDIRAYGSQDILLGGKELFRLSIMLDDENTHMLVRKTMTGGITYYDKYIFIDDDGLILGEFDSPFFFNNSFQ